MFGIRFSWQQLLHCLQFEFSFKCILGDPWADSGDEGKSKRAGKCGAKKSKERREEPLGTMSYQTSSKRSPPFWLLIGPRKTQVFWHQSEARTAATVWNWSGKTLSSGALLAVLYFSSFHIYFSARLDFPSPPLSAPGSPRMIQMCFLLQTKEGKIINSKHYTTPWNKIMV